MHQGWNNCNDHMPGSSVPDIYSVREGQYSLFFTEQECVWTSGNMKGVSQSRDDTSSVRFAVLYMKTI